MPRPDIRKLDLQPITSIHTDDQDDLDAQPDHRGHWLVIASSDSGGALAMTLNLN
jgi:hypothetical protein